MKKCDNCGNPINANESVCPNCGTKINNKGLFIIKEGTNNTLFDVITLLTLFMTISFVLVYVIIVCIVAGSSPNVDQSVGGFYFIVGVPIGWTICGAPLIVDLIISLISLKKYNKIVQIIEIILAASAIYTYNYFHSLILHDTPINKVFIISYMIMLICIIISIIINLVVHIKNEELIKN